MTPRKVLLLACVLAALTAGAWLAFSRSDRVERSEPLKALKEGEIVKLLIDRGETHIALEKDSGLWRLTAPVADLADPGAVSDILTGLVSLSLGSEVSQDSASYPAYALNESSATHVRLLTGGAAPVFDAYFGKEALGYDSLYIRMAGEKPVYIAAGLGAYRLNRSPDDYRERSLIGIDKALLQSVKLAAGKKTFDLSRSTGSWTERSGALKPEALASLAAKVAALRAASFAPKAPAGAFDKPFLVIEAAGTLKKARVVVGAAKPEEKKNPPLYRFAKADGRDSAFLVSISDLDELLREAGAAPSKR